MMQALAIRLAGPSDRQPIAGTLAEAFATGPVADWLIPDPSVRLASYHAHALAVYDDAIVHATVHTVDAYVGAAVWYPHDALPATPADPAGPDDEVAERFGQLQLALTWHTPREPHRQLAYLGVHPSLQRRGIGSALLRHQHHHLDHTGEAAFLIATSPGSRDLYLRHGYAVREEFALPAGPPLWSMWREPEGPLGRS